MNAHTARQRSRTYADLGHAFSEAEPGLESEFTRLLLGPGRPVAHPFESVYREGRTMGDCTLDVRRRLTDEGLAPRGKTLPDHVAVELAFMAHLAAQEAAAWEEGEAERAQGYLARQDRFLRDHLTAWLPQFCHRVLVGRPHAYYADLACRAEAFVTGDAARLRERLGLVPSAAEGDEAGMAAAVAERQRWAVTVGQRCTLCGICVRACRPGALQLVSEDNVAILRFDARACDGCAACQRWCPESVIGVARADERPPDGELARSELLACPRCGQPHAPAAMVAQVQARTGAFGEAMLRRLTLCPNCKAADVPLRPCTTSPTWRNGK